MKKKVTIKVNSRFRVKRRDVIKAFFSGMGVYSLELNDIAYYLKLYDMGAIRNDVIIIRRDFNNSFQKLLNKENINACC